MFCKAKKFLSAPSFPRSETFFGVIKMENFKPKTLEELNAEFALRLAHPAQEQAVVELPDEQNFSGESESVASFGTISADDIEPDIHAEVFEPEQAAAAPTETVSEAPAEEEPSESWHNEPNPTGYFGPPIDKSSKVEHKPKIEPKFEFEKTSDYTGAKLQKSFVQEKKPHRGAKIFLNVLITVIVIVSILTGLTAVATAEPGRFLFDRGLIICRHTVDGSNVSAGMLLFAKKASSAEDDTIVAAYTENGGYEIDFAQNISSPSKIFAVSNRGIPYLGGFISSVTSMWIVYACSAAAAILLILIIRVAAFDKDDDIIIGADTKKKRR